MRDNYQRSRKTDYGPRKNHQIRAKEVLLVDEEEGNLGVVTIQEAMAKAKEAEKDLVEVSPQANPPVVKIIDYSKYVYEQRKKQKQNSKSGKVKGMKEYRFTAVIDEHDINFRVKRALQYLGKGHPVRITMYRKGRQTKQQAEDKFAEILTKFEGYSTIEPDPKKEGRRIFITYKPNGETKKQKNSDKTPEKNKPKGEKEG